MPNGFTNFRSSPELDQRTMVLNSRIKKNEAKVTSSAASFQSDAETLRDVPHEKSMFRSMIAAMKHIAPKQ
ncbi:uncharacterized protein TRUGW13939_01311 [Talaromyces rugulosus]|uniref:Uncharacterized protein n=1 Tax=Talaromyces rugulosus TaxID=121627 RepID=A0A7H8QK10_TALRU|nr:uncharacterized protein TRUGW13939_01311 [Talaromyces rugulosus]QKX54226.1 hypothetical protein TRUGW13939_01311 [Talaromyces rugulosus]